MNRTPSSNFICSAVRFGLPAFAMLKARYFQLPHHSSVTSVTASVTFPGRVAEVFAVDRFFQPSGRYWYPSAMTMSEPAGMSSFVNLVDVVANWLMFDAVLPPALLTIFGFEHE